MYMLGVFLFVSILVIIAYWVSQIKRINNLFLAYIFLAASPYIAYKSFEFFSFVSAIPSAIEVSYPISIEDNFGFREGCGVAVFKMSNKTISSIEKNGINFFSEAKQARGHIDSYYYKYGPWERIWSELDSELPLFSCSSVGNGLKNEILSAIEKNGAYYTTKQEAVLVVIPSLGYVIFSYNG
jgi:hypothetical protein